MAVAELSARLGLGRLAYRLIYRPLGLVKQSIREGGPAAQAKDRVGHKEMKTCAAALAQLPEPPIRLRAEVAFLSGPKYWHQTLFCFLSLQLNLPFRVVPVIYDDGAINDETKARIQRVVPWARFVDASATEARLDALLPESRFPALRARRRVYPHLRKLIDIHVGSTEFRLVADSDMLFFRTPDWLVEWFGNPCAFYMQDVGSAYGYPHSFINELAGAPVPERVNVGLYAIDGKLLDWEQIESWCASQIDRFGPHYFQEQALTAMALAAHSATPLSASDYVVMPSKIEGMNPSAVLHHYVSKSKRAYYRFGWRRIFAEANARFGQGDMTVA